MQRYTLTYLRKLVDITRKKSGNISLQRLLQRLAILNSQFPTTKERDTMSDENGNNNNGSELAIVDPIQESGMLQLFGKDADQFETHSFNLADPTESMMYVNAVGGEAMQLSEFDGDTIEVSYYYAKPIQFAAGKNDTRYAEGELISGIRCVLVTPDGLQFYTTSPTQIKTIGALHKTPLGKKRFNPPIRFRLGKTRTRQGWYTQTLTIVPPEPKKPA